MRNPTRSLIAALGLLLMSVSVTFAQQTVQSSVGALERGYRTGYSDGYQSGYSDSTQQAARDYKNKEDYQRADRAYATTYGALEDYRDGYQQGFESGYSAGYERKGFNSTIPANLARRGTDDSQDNGSTSVSTSTGSSSSGGQVNTSNVTSIPANIVMRVELLTNLSTDVTQSGDRFQARVIEPVDFQGAMIEGHITRVKRPGKVRGSAELQLAFDKISLNGRWADFKAQVIEVIDTGNKGEEGEADDEGGVKAKNRTRDDVAKVGATAGIGAIIGAIFGGGKGAAIGAAIGAGVGTGSVLSSSGKNIRLEHGQQLRIRTASETQF